MEKIIVRKHPGSREIVIGNLDSRHLRIAISRWSKWGRGHITLNFRRQMNNRCYCPAGYYVHFGLSIRRLFGVFVYYSYFPKRLAPCYCDEVVQAVREGRIP